MVEHSIPCLGKDESEFASQYIKMRGNVLLQR